LKITTVASGFNSGNESSRRKRYFLRAARRVAQYLFIRSLTALRAAADIPCRRRRRRVVVDSVDGDSSPPMSASIACRSCRSSC